MATQKLGSLWNKVEMTKPEGGDTFGLRVGLSTLEKRKLFYLAGGAGLAGCFCIM